MCWPCIAIGVSPTEIPTAIRPLTTGGISRRGEDRRKQEQRRHAREDEDEAAELVALELAEQVGHGPTIVGIALYSSAV